MALKIEKIRPPVVIFFSRFEHRRERIGAIRVVIAVAALLVLALWLLNPIITREVASRFKVDSDELAAFADTYGFANSLFTGFALIGLIATLAVQIRDGRDREKDFKLELAEIRAQSANQQAQTRAHVFFEALNNFRSVAMNTACTFDGSLYTGVRVFELMINKLKTRSEQAPDKFDVTTAAKVFGTFLTEEPSVRPVFDLAAATFKIALNGDKEFNQEFDSFVCAHLTPHERALIAYFVEWHKISVDGDREFILVMRRSQLGRFLNAKQLVYADQLDRLQSNFYSD